MSDYISVKVPCIAEFLVPARLLNHYSVGDHQRLGSGTYGTVLRLKSKHRNNPDIAIKLFTNVFQSVSWANLALRELNLLNNTSHNTVVRMLGAYGTFDSGVLKSVYHITAYCGQNLREVINNETRYSMKQLKLMMSDLLRACKYLNSAEIIHRDVKPENMCIDVQNNWKLTLLDFGLARVVDKNKQMTEERGTHPYMSVEMMKGWTGNYDKKVDVWSIGAILCELLTGQVFFQDEIARYPIDVAIKKLGPIPESVMDQIGIEDARKRFRKKMAGAKRMDFSEYLREEGLSWLADAISLNEEHIVDFIDYALQFSQDIRMSVDEALAHPLLAEVRDISLEKVAEAAVPEEEPLPEDEHEAMVEVKRRIAAEIDAAPKYLE